MHINTNNNNNNLHPSMLGDATLTPVGLGVIGGYPSTEISLANHHETGGLTELSEADLKRHFGEITEEDEIFTNINDTTLELDSILGKVCIIC